MTPYEAWVMITGYRRRLNDMQGLLWRHAGATVGCWAKDTEKRVRILKPRDESEFY
jgi:hypothetical protein